nr:EOG090X0DK6 [Triops cancriformis]
MAERKSVNKYYPPDWRPEMGSVNKYHGTHALRERARKLHLGILIIRFEMPYNIWCEGCNNHIGMGVRYNAQKKKIGMYYSTPVYQFRMKCHLCDNHFEIKTDPGNLDYVIISGARRQENRWDPTQNGQVVPDDKAVIRKMGTDAMFKLEHGEKDAAKQKDAAPGLGKLQKLQGRFKDDYEANQALRGLFRKSKKELKIQAIADAALLAKSSLAIPLLPESEEDDRMASLLRLNPAETPEERQKMRRSAIENESFLSAPSSSTSLLKTAVTPRVKKILNLSLSKEALGIVPKSTSLEETPSVSPPSVEQGLSSAFPLRNGLVSMDYGTSTDDSD